MGWLPCGLGKLSCSPRLTGEGSCAILSPRPVTRSHAPVRLSVIEYGKIKPFYPLRGVPCLFRLFPFSHPNSDLDGHDSDFRGYIDSRIRDSTAGYAPPHPEGWGIRYPCTPDEVELKRDDSGTDVEWQAIKYVTYLSNFLLDDIFTYYAQYLQSDSGSRQTQDRGFH